MVSQYTLFLAISCPSSVYINFTQGVQMPKRQNLTGGGGGGARKYVFVIYTLVSDKANYVLVFSYVY